MLRQEGGGWEASDEEDFNVQLDVQAAGRERWKPDAEAEGGPRLACSAQPLAACLC